MRVSDCVACKDFPCSGVKHECCMIPAIDINPDRISIAMIAEAAPQNPGDYFYAKNNPLFAQTTVQAFQEAGATVSNVEDIIGRGVYLTTAVKCGKIGYGIQTETIKRCSVLLEKELALFPNLKILMLMGDVAIKALNSIAQRAGDKRAIPAGPTYKLRKEKYFYRGLRVFPSYLQAGKSYLIEKGKGRVIAEDIAAALAVR